MWISPESHLKNISYKIGYTGSDGTEYDAPIVIDKNSHIFEELKPSIWYTFSVTVIMNSQESESESVTLTSGKASDPVPRLIESSPYTLKISFDESIFAETNGPIETYLVILTEDYKLDNYSSKMSTWYDIQNAEMWPPYVTSPIDYNPFSDKRISEAIFTIGQDNCKFARPGERCNGPLKPLTLFYVKIRGCTKSDVCMESSYSKMATEKEMIQNDKIRYLNYSSTRSILNLATLITLFYFSKCSFM
uniref:protein-tyrosine-phosphatase n=1 Tax=Romanomermis culicivorax TaxID=13658 RepID=A0A915HV72_ROMCU